MSDGFFPYDFDLRFAFIWRSFGAKPSTDGVTVSKAKVVATYGRFRVETPLSNVQCASETGPYQWWRAVGLRGSLVDSGITFGTTPRGGVCIMFKKRIPQVAFTAKAHAGLTVTVADGAGLITALLSTKG